MGKNVSYNYVYTIICIILYILHMCINECKDIPKQKIFSHIWIIYKNIMRPSNYDFETYKRSGLRSTIWMYIISHSCDIGYSRAKSVCNVLLNDLEMTKNFEIDIKCTTLLPPFSYRWL